MKIKYLGHSSFLLSYEDGTKIVTDPYGGIGYSFPHVSADAVTVSHGHYDHCNAGAVDSPLVLDRAGNFRVGSVSVTAIAGYHDDAHGKKRGASLVFRFEGDGISVCHFGDLGEPYGADARRFGRSDVLLLPVGGNYTIDAAEAEKYVRGLRPAVVIPMHFYTPGLTVDIAGPEAFLKRFPKFERAGCEIELHGGLPGGEPRIILMERM